MKIRQYIFFYFLLIITYNNCFFDHANSLEFEIKKHFNNMINSINELPANITGEGNFPSETIIPHSKIEIDSNDNDLFLITLTLSETIKAENIITEKGTNYIKININFNESYYQIMLKEDELSIVSEHNQKVKNANNTKYAHSSSQISRKERLSKSIDLNSLKVKVDSKDKTIQLVTKYIDPKKHTGIDIEFK
jgi:hypothetical protein